MILPDILIAAAATAYLAYVVTHTDGMFGMFAWARQHDPIRVTHCIWCSAFWLALLVLGVLRWGEPFTAAWLVEAFAAAGLGIMALAYTGAKHL